MERVPREAFVPESSAYLAYEDIPLPIGEGQTISQPYIVALMVSALELRRTDKVLEIGTGSGYQAAVLSELASEVISVERIKSLADSARQRLASLGYSNVKVYQAEDPVRLASRGPIRGDSGGSGGAQAAGGVDRAVSHRRQAFDSGGFEGLAGAYEDNQDCGRVFRSHPGFLQVRPPCWRGAWQEDNPED